MFYSNMKSDEMKLSREVFFLLKLLMKVIYLISLQNPHRFYTVMFLYYCSSLSPVTQPQRLQIAWRLPKSGMMPQALLHVLCVKVRWWRGKTKMKSQRSVPCGQQFLQDTSGEFVSEKEACVFVL